MNQIETGAIYIQATRGVAERNHSFPTPEVEPAIVAYTKSYDRPYDHLENGVNGVTLKISDGYVATLKA